MAHSKRVMSGTRQLSKSDNRAKEIARRVRCPRDKTLTIPYPQAGQRAQRCPKCLTVYTSTKM